MAQRRRVRRRRLCDAEGDNPVLSPLTEEPIIVGDRLLEPPRHGFSRVGSQRGAEHVLPLALTEQHFLAGRWPLRLQVRHYLQQAPDSGVVRVAATRLVDLKLKEADECRTT